MHIYMVILYAAASILVAAPLLRILNSRKRNRW